MKKILFAVFAMVVLASCSKEEVIEKQDNKTIIVQMEVVNAAGHSSFYVQQVVR